MGLCEVTSVDSLLGLRKMTLIIIIRKFIAGIKLQAQNWLQKLGLTLITYLQNLEYKSNAPVNAYNKCI